ncbi:phage/plasmid primase, P4 family [Glutamicibacter arilaitensis]|uniref:phage/plasmid primase, P4 family n=1 Tax=Glutamicibacter arilaitensis TaxID=256701 RepID=UPI003850AF62
MTSILEAATELHHAGCSVVPVMADGSKRPAGQWKRFTQGHATTTELTEWFNPQSPLGLGIVTGPISGNLEMTEVEAAAAPRLQELADLAHNSGLGDLWTQLCTGWLEQSPSGGYHWFYTIKDDTVPGNTKIAKDHTNQVLAETRGAGGFVITAPSTGGVHPTGLPYVRLSGGPRTIPSITMDEREAFHGILSTLGATPPEPHDTLDPSVFSPHHHTNNHNAHGGLTPGDDYENKTDWAQILEPHGWTLVFARGRTRYWCRPGKKNQISATTGHADDRDRLYVFSSNGAPFETDTPYTKFGAHSLLKHGGDYSKTASELNKAGYGQERRVQVTPPPAPALVVAAVSDTQTATDWAPAPATASAAPITSNAPAPVVKLDDHRTNGGTSLAHSDDGNALNLVKDFGHLIRYAPERGRWIVWDGIKWVWQERGGNLVREYAKQVARRMPEDDKGTRSHKKSALSAVGITNMLTQASTDPAITVRIDDLDARPWELNTPGGIINLRTGQLEPNNPEHLHTKVTACAPNPNADTTIWDTFLATTFPNNNELTGYMQRLAGYSVVGEVREHVLPFAHGNGGNGKGVFMETIASILGDYATSTPSGFLMAGPYQNHSTEIARLTGMRWVICSEVNEGDRWDEAKVKQLTGGDRLTARFMRQDDFTFKPTHHLWIMGNHQPAVESGGDSFWRRLRLIPFTHTVAEEARVEDLQSILANEHGPAVLAWIARGAAQYAAGGLSEPDQVKAATREYAQSVDTVARFLDEECITGDAATHMSTPTTVLLRAYQEWCKNNGEHPMEGRAFTTKLTHQGILTGRKAPRAGNMRMYGRVGIIATQEQSDPHEGDRGGY